MPSFRRYSFGFNRGYPKRGEDSGGPKEAIQGPLIASFEPPLSYGWLAGSYHRLAESRLRFYPSVRGDCPTDDGGRKKNARLIRPPYGLKHGK